MLLLLVLCVVAGLASQAPAQAALREVPDDSVRADGRVYAILRSGDRVYIAGNFQHVNGEPRTRLAAIDARTGDLTDWNPGASAAVHALAASPDGSFIYAGGSFTRVDGSEHRKVAAIDAATGRDDTSWDVAVRGTVYALSVSNGRLFIGGKFSKVNGQIRRNLAAVDAAGDAVPGWKGGTNGVVYDTKIRGSRLYVGGEFSYLSGNPRRNLGALAASSGRRTSFKTASPRPVIDLAISDRGVFAAQGGRGGAVASYGLVNGRRNWYREATGDVQAITVAAGRVFAGGHFTTVAGQRRERLAAFYPNSGKLDRRWTPRVDEGVWELTPDVAARKLYMGGDFKKISGKKQPRFARFSL